MALSDQARRNHELTAIGDAESRAATIKLVPER